MRASPLVLRATDAWAEPYCDPHNIKFTERALFAQSTEMDAAPV
ncbi:hypothetical protein [Ralstonia solanacearum]|nr:hypothetical protein [Ralstonia solanacearum]